MKSEVQELEAQVLEKKLIEQKQLAEKVRDKIEDLGHKKGLPESYKLTSCPVCKGTVTAMYKKKRIIHPNTVSRLFRWLNF